MKTRNLTYLALSISILSMVYAVKMATEESHDSGVRAAHLRMANLAVEVSYGRI